ncbi:excalibur calcium-binding domain-containing protein [Paenibacillus sp. 1182]|uniref:excalibur calcium-binding domain-containing protein n=1 Tax=Paenibacillus sp. 1182 TaxID=2806565 RepID=UPI001FD85464|nr:excalibur calcium-binding domain-containing protein [Paenibacillus sp. 1182]
MFVVPGGKELLLTKEQTPKVPSESSKSSVPNNSSKHDTQKAKATDNVSYTNCSAVKKAGLAPLHRGEPGYSKKLDRDGDGVACEL